MVDDEPGRLLGRDGAARIEPKLGALGWLVGRVDAGEVLELPPAGLGVETLAVAGFGHLERGVDVDLEELAVADQARASSRSARNGDMNETSTMRPASTMMRATSATRRMFSTRSASVKPRSLFSPWRTLSPSSR